MKWYGGQIEEPRTDAHHHTVYEKDNPTVDIHKIIDDAMAKGDRTVYILIHDGHMSVDVRPYTEEKVQWIHIGNGHFKCSDCGYEISDCGALLPVYCGGCGEKLHGVRDMLEETI